MRWSTRAARASMGPSAPSLTADQSSNASTSRGMSTRRCNARNSPGEVHWKKGASNSSSHQEE
ncbi:hypothetical protein ACN28S_41695 [Cystobacter fuscus]